MDNCTEIEIECPFTGVTSFGRVWRKVSESQAQECPFSGVTSFGRVWRKVPESEARSVGDVDLSHCAKASSRTSSVRDKCTRLVCVRGNGEGAHVT